MTRTFGSPSSVPSSFSGSGPSSGDWPPLRCTWLWGPAPRDTEKHDSGHGRVHPGGAPGGPHSVGRDPSVHHRNEQRRWFPGIVQYHTKQPDLTMVSDAVLRHAAETAQFLTVSQFYFCPSA